MGLTKAPHSAGLTATYDSVRDSTTISGGPGPGFMLEPREGVNMITGIMHVARRPPTHLAPLELDLLVTGVTPRPADQRVLSFQVDDSTHITVGLTTETPGFALAPGRTAEHLIIMIPPEQALTLLRARALRGSLGATTFAVSNEDHNRLRSVVLAALCGAQ